MTAPDNEDAAHRLHMAIGAKARCSFGNWPTPLEEAPRLSSRLGVQVFIKRDDQSGLALGGNKVRKLEFLIADALANGADSIVTTGGSQSNHARLAAAACRRTGLNCYLILDRGVHPESQGNLLLDHLFGAHITLIDSADPLVASDEMEKLATDLRSQGHKPYVIPRGGSVPVGATGYAAFALEIVEQLASLRLTRSHIYLGTGSTGTHSGVLAGLAALDHPISVQGISVSRTESEQVQKVLSLTTATLEYLSLSGQVEAGHIAVDDRFRGAGYGLPEATTMEAIQIAALDEGLILDPVYSGKAMAGLIGHAREGRLRPTDNVVFLHTGGAPALFAYNRETSAAIGTSAT